MKKQLLTLLISLLAYSTYSQILFEKGYYINNTGEKIEGLIKNIDWKNSPLDIEFKLSEETESKNITINNISEFGIYNICKYKRYTIDIDRSSEFINNISLVKNPEFKEETLFLKVLIEGKASLLQYSYQSLTRYFYNVDDSNVKQLVYKSYKNDNNEIVKNNEYKQQLFNSLKCEEISMRNLQYLDYNQKDLFNLFKKYNNCNNSEITYVEQKNNKGLFNLTPRIGVNYSSLELDNLYTNSYDVKYKNQLKLRIGIEAEFVLPFNKNKWSIIAEPTYQRFKDENFILNGRQRVTVDYKSLEIPIGVRHYMFFNENSKLFVNGSLIISNSGKSNILFEEGNFSNSNYDFDNPRTIRDLPIKTSINWGIGIGYKFKNKYSLEYRIHTKRRTLEIPSGENPWDSNYSTSSFIFGYTIF